MNLFHWWAKYIGRVTIPKWYRFYHLLICDFCGDNLIDPCSSIIDYGWFKTCWHKDYRLGYIYGHARKSDCDANKYLQDEKEKKRKEKELKNSL